MRTKSSTKVRVLIGGTAGVLLLMASAGCGGSGPSSNAAAGNAGGGGQAATGSSVNIVEKLGPPDSYSFSPATATVASGQSVSVVNKTDEDHKLSCTPDPGISADMLTVDKSATQSLSFSKAGTYSCASSTHPEAKLTITVS
ncbi:MAG: hypothetical protein V7603_6268 [Micromonosporaceae bacterium]